MRKLTFFILFLGAMAQSFAATKYWVGATNSNWSATSSWSDTPTPGTPGAAVPTETDDVFFETGALTAALTADVIVNSITFNSSNTTFSGTFGITTNNMTVNNSQPTFVYNVTINSSLSMSGTSTTPKINVSPASNGFGLRLGNGGSFTLTGHTATNNFAGNSNAYFTFNTTTPLTVYFTSATLGNIVVLQGLITLGSSTQTQRLNLAATNSQELIIGANNTLTLSGNGTSAFSVLTNSAGGAINASAAGSKFTISSTNASVLTTPNRIFKENSTINNLEFNSSTKTLTLAQPIRVRTLTKTAGTINNNTNSITLAPGGSVTGTGTTTATVLTGTALTRYWVGGTTGNWSLASNWGISSGSTSTPGFPELGDNVVFDAAVNASPTVTLTQNVTAENISFVSSNVTFAGAFGITTNSMTANSSQVKFVDAVTVNTALTFAGTDPRITYNASASGNTFTLGNGSTFTLTGNSTTNYITGNSNAYFTFNTSSSLTVYFNPTTANVGGIRVSKGLITLGNSLITNRLFLSGASSQELILGTNTTLTINGNNGSTFSNPGGVIDASATGSKFVVKATSTSFLSSKKIFKDATTINHLQMNASGETFTLGFPLTVKTLTLTAGTINNTNNNITIPSGGNLVVGAGTTTAALVASVPSAPTIGIATAGNAQAAVAFTAPSANGGSLITSYTVTPYVGATAGTPVTSNSNPVVVTGLTNGTTYTFTVKANNSVGASAESAATALDPPVIPHATNNNIEVSASTNISALTLTPVSDVVVSGNELTIDETKTINSITVNGGAKLTVPTGKTLTLTNLTLKSDASSTATYKPEGTGALVVNGTTAVEQYLTYTRNYYVSSPVSNAVAPAGYTYYSRYEPGGIETGWTPVSVGAGLTAGKGYIALPTSAGAPITFTTQNGGTLNTGNITIPLSYTPEATSGNGYNLIGNPYPSHLNWNQTFTDANVAKIEPSIWYRSKVGNGNNGGWSFKTYNALLNEGSPLGTTGVIPPMQGFWVLAKQTTTIEFTDDMRSHETSNPLKIKAVQNTDRKKLRVQVAKGTRTDEALIVFDANALDGYDAYDSPKIMNDVADLADIYTVTDAKKLVINGLNSVKYDTEIPLGFSTLTAGDFNISANEISNFEVGTKVYLIDKLNHNTEFDLTDGNDYAFSSDAVNNTSRFSLIFRAPGVATGFVNPEKESVLAYVNAANQITIIAPAKSNYAIYNGLGQLMENGILNTERETRNTKLAAGVYVVKVGNESTRVVIK